MRKKLKIDLQLLLPQISDPKDSCIERLLKRLENHRNVLNAHIDYQNPTGLKLCVHFNPNQIDVGQVQALISQEGIQIAERYGHAIFRLVKIGSEDAAQQVEKSLSVIPGVLHASVNLAAQIVKVEFDRELVTQTEIEASLSRTCKSIECTFVESFFTPAKLAWFNRNSELLTSILSGVILLIAWICTEWQLANQGVLITLYLSAYLVAAYKLIIDMLQRLWQRSFSFDIDFLMLIAAIGAAAIGEWLEGGFLLFLFSLAHAGEHYALSKARNAIKSLSELTPNQIRVWRAGKEEIVPIEDVKLEEVVIVHPGERIPIDGIIKSGSSSINQAPITGESVPVEKIVGQEVFAGTVNGEGALEIITTKVLGDRTLDRVIQLVEEAQTQKAPTQLFTESFQKIFVPIVLVADLVLMFLPPLLGFWTFEVSFYRAMSLLVAASPCALALGTPATVLAGIAQAARNGVLIKGGVHLENLGTVEVLAFDKTGTITSGKPEVAAMRLMPDVSEAELLKYAAAVEQRSQHPLANAVVKKAQELGIKFGQSGDLQSITGRGVRADVDGVEVVIGKIGLWQELNVAIPEQIKNAVSELQNIGMSILIVRAADRWLGVIGVADTPKPLVKETLNILRSLKLKSLVMLTGDNEGVAKVIGAQVGLDQIYANLLPEDKLDKIRELDLKQGRVAMIGDGVNDAPALATATVGIAMGGAGSAVALETADVVLLGGDLTRIPFAIELSRASRSIIKQNLYIALGVIILLVISAVFGLMRIGPTVVIHEGSTIVVILNALRLLTFKGSAAIK